jgi:hypothetical protein
MPAKQQTVATEQESGQAEKEDTTQLYIGLNIIVKGLGWVGFCCCWLVRLCWLMLIRVTQVLGLVVDTCCKVER